MQTITVHGSSDDHVEVDGCKGADEFGTDNWRADLIAPDGGQAAVYCWFTGSGCWAAGVSQVDEDVPLPDWPLRISNHERGGSVLLTIEAPDGTRLVASGLGVTDADLAVLMPQYRAVLDILRTHKLGWSLEDLAGLVTLKVVAMTWQQVSEAAPELAVSRG